MTARPWRVLIPADVAEAKPTSMSYSSVWAAERRAMEGIYGDGEKPGTEDVAIIYNTEDDNHRIVLRRGMEQTTEFWTDNGWVTKP